MDSILSYIDIPSLLVYDPKRPLLFTQFYFWGFFVIVMAFYALIYKKKAIRNIYLFVASVFFYYKTGISRRALYTTLNPYRSERKRITLLVSHRSGH